MLKTIDLFAGAGGLSLGFEMTGKFKVLAAAEINKNAQATYKKNIVEGKPTFTMIEDINGYDFMELNEKLGGIDVVIGGPPCQGFSNANRQKNHLISMNNSLVKEFFRAIKEIKPKAFVMENVSMLRSDTHRFYESISDNEEIDALIEAGFDIPKRLDSLFITNEKFENIDYTMIDDICLNRFLIPIEIFKLLNILYKNLSNERRLVRFLEKNRLGLIRRITTFLDEEIDASIKFRLHAICDSLTNNNIENKLNSIEYIVNLQKVIHTIQEIKNNGLIGKFEIKGDSHLIFKVNSYSVIDYINAILGGEYSQIGSTVNAEWFGVPQTRRRYIVIGIRKDLYPNINPSLPGNPDTLNINTVEDAIMDLVSYEAGYEKDYKELPYNSDDILSDYANMMRQGSETVKNHITTKTSELALKRFEAIKPGQNFHSLSENMKNTYTKPERTQNTIYLRLKLNEPSGTVVNVRKSMWIHPILNRGLTVREAARLQSFPDKFGFVGTKDSQFQQVGNAVPPLLAKAIAQQILNYIL